MDLGLIEMIQTVMRETKDLNFFLTKKVNIMKL